MFICCICEREFGHLTSLKNHKKVHKNCYKVENETDTSFNISTDENTDSYISDESKVKSQIESDSIFDDQETTNESDLTFNDYKITNESDSIFEDQEATNESDSMCNDQETNNKSDSMFDDQKLLTNLILCLQEIVDEYDFMFNNYGITDEFSSIFKNDDDSIQIVERNILKECKKTNDQCWSDDKSLIELYKYDKECISEILDGLCHLVPAMNDYFDLISVFKGDMKESEVIFTLYKSFTLPNKEQVRATRYYHNIPVFINIAIYMDSKQIEFEIFDEYCFAK
ncbi:25428_t:CDS:2, partial [Racocetra persica]